MPEETHGFLHFGKKDDDPPAAPKEPPQPADEHHGLLDLFKKEETPPPPPTVEEHHGLLGLFKKEEPPPPPPLARSYGWFRFGRHQDTTAETQKAPVALAMEERPSGSWLARLFHRAPVTPEPASPKRPQLVRHHSVRSALYILGALGVLSGLLPGILPDGYRFYGLIAGGALLLGGLLLTGDWHPLTGMLGLRRVRLPTSAGGIAALVAEREAKEAIEYVTKSSDEPEQPLTRRLAPWHWPWSQRARAAAQEQQAEREKAFKHVGLGGKILMGILLAVMGHGANLILQYTPRPPHLNAFTTFAHWAIILATIVLILLMVTTRIRTFRRHWLGLSGLLRRALVFFVVAAIAALVAGILTEDPLLGQGYGELIGGLAGILAVLF